MAQVVLESEGAPPAKSKDIVVFMVRRETKCAECGRDLFDGNFLRMEENRRCAWTAPTSVIWNS